MTFLWVSRSYADWLGKNPADLAGRHIADGIGPSAFAAIRPYIERVLAGERCEFERKVEYQSIGPRWIRAAYVPTHGRGGEVDGWVAHVSDSTALKHAEAEVVRVNADLQRTNERLARSNEDLERFAFIASHDLQEPLRMITAYAQLLVRSYPTQFEGEGNMFVRNIVDGATRMRGLLADLLAYSEIDSDAAEPAHRVDLNEVLETVRQNLKVAVEEAGAEIASGPLPAVTGYTVHFVQLFQNLVANAIKYRGQQPPRIQISCERGGGGWRFAVADNGLGIDPEYHTRIFGIFKRLHGKKIPGTGIGLAICQRVVERYGGQIWVESERGRGATFCFTIPENDGERGERSNA
jgi:PAS domain S-box-containing protein